MPSREEVLEWAAKIAVACRCAQEVRRPNRLIEGQRPAGRLGARSTGTHCNVVGTPG
jgi:hypothetical protein